MAVVSTSPINTMTASNSLTGAGPTWVNGAPRAAEPDQFAFPSRVTVAPDGAVFVADNDNHRIQVFDAAGRFLRMWGSEGNGKGQFTSPGGMAVAPDGTIYVADQDSARIQYFDGTGTYLGEWGSAGDGNGQLAGPSGVAVAPDGTVYVADTNNFRIQAFDAAGAYLDQWGTPGIDDGQFYLPGEVTLSPDGRTVYVADTFNDRVQAFCASTRRGKGSAVYHARCRDACGLPCGGDTSASAANQEKICACLDASCLLLTWGTEGNGPGQFSIPRGAAAAPDGTIYVVDAGNPRIQYFDSAGVFLGQWKRRQRRWAVLAPFGVAVAPGGTVYVVEQSSRVRRSPRMAHFWVAGGAPAVATGSCTSAWDCGGPRRDGLRSGYQQPSSPVLQPARCLRGAMGQGGQRSWPVRRRGCHRGGRRRHGLRLGRSQSPYPVLRRCGDLPWTMERTGCR